MIEIKAKVIEAYSGTAKASGRPYHTALIQLESGRVGKIFAEVPQRVDLENVQVLEISLTPGADLSLTPRIVEKK